MMTDKPKRKNTPNRRGKFLLMIVLPSVALITGFMALSPQIDAWLATDPFMPQCHFEEDRLFATGYPLRLTSTNLGQYEDIEIDNIVGIHIKWSPDGNYIAYTIFGADGRPFESMILSPTGEILYEFEDWTAGLQWSSDSRYVTYNQSNKLGIFDMDTKQDISDILPNEIDGFNEKTQI
jgi:hypothetical protein